MNATPHSATGMTSPAPTLTRRSIPGLHGFSGSPHRLLTPAEEIQLGRLVVAGLGERHGAPDCSFNDLAADSPAREAADTLVLLNTRLVLSMARHHQPGDGRTFEDAVQDGLTGLMRAVLGFDPEAGTRFATYADLFIRRAMIRGRQFDAGLVRLPVHVHDKVLSLRRYAEQAGTDVSQLVVSHPEGMPELDISGDVLRSIWAWSHPFEPLDNADEAPVVVLGTDGPSAEMVLDEHALEEVLSTMASVDARAVVVVARRFGLFGYERASREDVAAVLGISRETVRQIEKKALRAALDFICSLSREDWQDVFAA